MLKIIHFEKVTQSEGKDKAKNRFIPNEQCIVKFSSNHILEVVKIQP